eukprot:GHVH01009043.1.p1 GENE.GHVH01009043.1~~GHVH01009043.1.p1  ORF type:complete len:898 (+),score=119.69 GHVH01009043.1:63-2756(+)
MNLVDRANEVFEHVMTKFRPTEDSDDEEVYDEQTRLLPSPVVESNPFGSSLFFTDMKSHGRQRGAPRERRLSSHQDAPKGVKLRKRRSDTLYAFEVSIDVPPVKYIDKRAATADFCKYIEIDKPNVKDRWLESGLSWFTGSTHKNTRGHRATLPVDPNLISNFDYVVPVHGLQGIDVKSPHDAIVEADLATEILMRIFVGRIIRDGSTCVDCDDIRSIDPLYGLEPFINKRMSEKTLRKVVLNRFIHLICNIMDSDIIRIVDSDSAELWCIALSENGAMDIAHRLGYYLKLSRCACMASGRFGDVLVDEQPQTAFDLRYEPFMQSSRIGKVPMMYLWNRYNRLGDVVDLKTAGHLANPELSIFTPVNRLQLLDLSLTDYLDLDEFVELIGLGDQPFSLHQPILQERLRIESASFRHVWWPSVGLSHIRSYFGEEIALYFSFLSHYTYSLMIPSLMAFIMWRIQMTYDPKLTFKSKGVAYSRATFAMGISLWVNFMVYTWRKKQRRLEIKWGVNQGQREFRANRMANLKYRYDSWIVDDRYPSRFTKFYDPRKKKARRMLAYLGGALSISVIAVLTNPDLHELFFKYYDVLDDLSAYFDEIPFLNYVGFEFDSTVTTITILFLHRAFSSLSMAMAKLENHKYLNTYNKSIIKKFAFFSGLDYLGPFLYLAFLKRYFSEYYEDSEDRYLFLLMKQLRNLFLVEMFGNVLELGMPFVKRQLTDRILLMRRMQGERKGTVESANMSKDPALLERRLPTYDSTLDDYIEIVVQLSLVGSFAVTWTPVAVLAMIANLLESRVDLIKLVSFYRRPRPTPAVSIEAWDDVLSAIASISIVLPNLMVVFVLVPQARMVTRLTYVFLATIICFSLKYSFFTDIKNDKYSVQLLRKRNAVLQDVMSNL